MLLGRYPLPVRRPPNDAWADWLSAQMQRCGFATNKDLERASGIDNTVISRWRGEGTTPSVKHLRQLAAPLRTPLLQLMVKAGHLTPAEAQLREVAAPSSDQVAVDAAVEADPDLLPEAKEHLVKQYRLLRRLVAEPSYRAVASGGDPAHRAEVTRIAREERVRQTGE